MTPCPICSVSTKPYLSLKINGLQAVRCPFCSHVHISNSPITAENAKDYYTMDDYMGQRKLQSMSWASYYRDCLYDYRRFLPTSPVLKGYAETIDYIYTSFPERNGRLLDVGCATGVFCDMVRQRGWSAEGVEISAELAAYAREHFGLVVHETDLANGGGIEDKYDVITMLDVIEHLPDPMKMLNACSRLLKNGGLLVVRTPSEDNLLRDIAKAVYWTTLKRLESPLLWFYSYEHIQSFSAASLRCAMRGGGLTVLTVWGEDESLGRVDACMALKCAGWFAGFVSWLVGRQHKMVMVGKRDGNKERRA